MNKILAAGILGLLSMGSAQAANVPLASFNAIPYAASSATYYADVLGAGASISRGFELSDATGDVNIEFLSLRIPSFTETPISVSYYLDANNDNLLDPTTDLLLASINGSRSSLLRTLNIEQAFFVTYLNTSNTNVTVNTAFTPQGADPVTPVPLPAAAWLFGSALFMLGRRQWSV